MSARTLAVVVFTDLAETAAMVAREQKIYGERKRKRISQWHTRSLI